MATTLRFTIGDAFPADAPVARFITVLAMISNDWSRLVDQMLRIEDHDRSKANVGANPIAPGGSELGAPRSLPLKFHRES